MQSFFQIKSKPGNINFISMEEFNKFIKKKKSNDQRSLSPFKDSLDLFYLSLLVGLKHNLKSSIDKYELGELTDEWTTELSENSNAKDYIIAIYLTELIKNVQNDKVAIKEILNRSLDSKKKSSLSKEGFKEVHEYCFGGYEKILETFNNQPPSSIVDFFYKYKKLIDTSN